MKKHTKKIIIGSAILLFLGAGFGVTYYVVNQGSDSNSANQETSSEYATFMDAAQADADIENEITEEEELTKADATEVASTEEKVDSEEKETTAEGKLEEKVEESKPTVSSQELKPSSTQGTKPSESKPASTTQGSTKPAESKPEESKPSTVAQAKECSHNWVARYKTVYHDAVTHTEEQKVCVREAYTEDVYDWRYKCNGCGQIFDPANSPDERTIHCYECQGGSSYNVEQVLVDTVEHPAEYETKTVTVVDKEAWDEEVVEGYTCSQCGATK